jgi:hypothetical protein
MFCEVFITTLCVVTEHDPRRIVFCCQKPESLENKDKDTVGTAVLNIQTLQFVYHLSSTRLM